MTMRSLLRRLRAVLIIFSACACTHSVHLVHTGDFDPGVPKSKGRMIEARTEKFIILGFAGDTDYVNDCYRKLQGACRDGQIQGITTQFSTSHGFLSYTNKILMRGLCVR